MSSTGCPLPSPMQLPTRNDLALFARTCLQMRSRRWSDGTWWWNRSRGDDLVISLGRYIGGCDASIHLTSLSVHSILSLHQAWPSVCSQSQQPHPACIQCRVWYALLACLCLSISDRPYAPSTNGPNVHGSASIAIGSSRQRYHSAAATVSTLVWEDESGHIASHADQCCTHALLPLNPDSCVVLDRQQRALPSTIHVLSVFH